MVFPTDDVDESFTGVVKKGIGVGLPGWEEDIDGFVEGGE
jgi:hypothetical protein